MAVAYKKAEKMGAVAKPAANGARVDVKTASLAVMKKYPKTMAYLGR